jgi:hypothetical protein
MGLKDYFGAIYETEHLTQGRKEDFNTEAQ